MTCVHTPLESSLDRWHECHWHLHQMEANYHQPDAFRYALNAFIRAIADVPDALDLSMPCRHAPELVRVKRYSQREFFMSVDGIDMDKEERKWQEDRARRVAAASTGGAG